MDNINRLRIENELSIEDTSKDHVYTVGVNELTADRTITLPLLTGNDTFAFEAHSQTLTNKTINTASNTLTVAADDVTSGTFADARVAQSNITQHEAAINHDNLTGFVANEHIDHSTVSITAGSGLSGGGTIATNRTIDLDINSLTADATPDGAADYIATYDTSAIGHKKVLLNNMPVPSHNHAATDVNSGTFANARIAQSNVTQHETAINHDNLTGFVANEHIDHSTVSVTAGIGLSGGGTIATTRTIDLDINSLTADATPDSGADYVVTYDTSATGHKKVLLNNIPVPSHNHATADVTSGTFADARISQSNVTQHEAAITHQNLSGAGTNTHAQIDTHISDATKHRIINDAGTSATELWSASKISTELATKSGTSHTHIINDLTDITITTPADNEVLAYNTGTSEWINQTPTEAGLAEVGHVHATGDITSGTFADARIAQTNVTQHEGAITHQNISGAGTNTHAQIDTHLADATVHFTEASIVHQNIVGAGTNTHAQLDTHLADSTLHRVINDAGTLATELWSASKITSELSGKAGTSHTHTINDLTDITITTPADNEVLAYNTGTSQWINQTPTEAGLSEIGHTHTAANITDFSSSVDARISLQAGANDGLATLDSGGKVPASQLNLDNVDYQGTWNASTNTPTLVNSTGTKGYYYVVSTSGTTNIDGVTDWETGDWIIFNGTVWEKSDHTDQVTSVAGKQGAVTLATGDIASGTFADARIAQTNVTQHEGAITHQNLSGAGTNTHAQIDSHISDATKHRIINDAGTLTTELWSASKITSELGTKAGTSHTHIINDLTDITITTPADNEVLAYNTGTSEWINQTPTEAGLAEVGHVHATGDITSGTFADARIAQTNVTQHEGAITHQNLSGAGTNTHAQIDTHLADATVHFTEAAIVHQNVSGAGTNTHAQIDTHLAANDKHRIINDAGTLTTELWSASKITSELATKSGTSHTHSTADITSGTLGLTRGGTGQTTKIAAFDGLAPTTTKGDLILNDGTNNIRLGVGGDGKVLKALASDANGVVWGTDPTQYDAIVCTSGNCDYTSVAAAFTAGHKTVFIRDGQYTETSDINIPNSGALVGESLNGVAITMSGSVSVKCDANLGVKEKTGSISISNGGTTVTGSGTLFTNITKTSKTFIIIEHNAYPVTTITNNTSLTIGLAFKGTSISGGPYILQDMNSSIIVANITIIGSTVANLFVRGLRHCVFNSVVTRNGTPNFDIEDSVNTIFQSCMSQNSFSVGFDFLDTFTCTMAECQSFNSTSHGINIAGISRNIVVDSTQCANGSAAGLNITGTSTNIQVTGCIFNNNNTLGINTDSSTGTAVITGCTMRHNGSHGIDFDGSDDIVDGCIIYNNGGRGIQAGIGGTISTNHITNNTAEGIGLEGDTDCCIVGNHITGNSIGISAQSSSHRNSITSNYITGSTTFGIYFNGGDDNVISGNVIYNNSSNGIQIITTALRTVISNNKIQSNVIGINVATGCIDTNITGNTVTSNSSHGISCTANTCIINSNRVTLNTGSGIRIETGAVDVTYQGNNTLGNTGTNFVDNGTITNLEGILSNDVDSRSATTLLIGKSTATKVEIADTGIITEVQGNLDVLEGLDVTGNITTTGTVDGRDVSVDGTKLDGIASGATANDTDANLKNRTNHTGTQLASTISNFDSTVTSSTHAGRTDNPHTVTKAQIGLTNVPDLKVKLNATVAPIATDDSGSGYAVGSSWVDVTGDKAYICVDATATSAIWTEVTSQGELDHTNLTNIGTNTHAQIDTHIAATTAHGISGNVVGTTDSQTLTNKTINTASNTITVATADVTSGTFADARIAASNVTQHEAGLTLQNLGGTLTVAKGGTGVTTHTTNAILKGNSTSAISSSGWTIDGNNVMTVSENVTGFILDIHNTNPSGGNGFHIHAGEAAGDLAFKITDRDNTFNIMEMEANNGYIVTHKTYAQTLIDNGIVYGFDNQHTGVASDFNTQSGIYRIGGVDVANVAQTLTNKTLTAPIISTISNTGTLTLPTSTDTLVGRATTDTLTNKTLTLPVISSISNGGTITVPSGAGTLATIAGAQTLTNKTITSTTNNVAAQSLHSATTVINVNAATAPTNGQVLTATSGTTATWQTSETGVTDHTLLSNIGTNTHAQIDTHIADATKHRIINDAGTSATELWSASKINTQLAEKSSTSHTHAINDVSDITITTPADNEILAYNTGTGKWINQTPAEAGLATASHVHATGDITSGTFIDARIAQSNVTQHEAAINHDNLTGFVANEHIDWTADAGASNIHDNNIVASNITQHEGSLTLQNLGGTLTVAKGGTGVTTLASGNILRGNGTGAITATLAAPSGALVGTTDAQTLTNKTMTATTNNVAAKSLHSATTVVSVSAATAPTSGQVLTATSSTAATWQTPSAGAITYHEVSATGDTSTTSPTYATINSMTYTPASGTYLVKFSTSGKSSSTSSTSNWAIHKAGIILSHSERLIGTGGGAHTNSLDLSMATQGIVTVNGSEAIDIRFKTGGGTFTIHERSMILTKLA